MTFIYFENTQSAATECTKDILNSLRLVNRFRTVENIESNSSFKTFTSYPSTEKQIKGVGIYESMVPKDSQRSRSRGKVFNYFGDTPSWQRSVEQAQVYFQDLSATVAGVVEFSDRLKGKSDGSSMFTTKTNKLWIKMDGDRVSRGIALSYQDTFETMTTKILLRVDAPGAMENYCLVDSKNRLMETLPDLMKSLMAGSVVTVLKRQDAFVARESESEQC